MPDLHKTVVAAFVFIQKFETILLVKQGYGEQYWSLPGGVMEAGESIDQAAIREVKEETGLDIRLGKLIGGYSKPGEGALALMFKGFIDSGELQADNEVIEVRYFPLANPPYNIRAHLRLRVEDFQANLPNTVIRLSDSAKGIYYATYHRQCRCHPQRPNSPHSTE
jgi:ADP-ribose pyrophosphatase YjhB (NUDIX family)